MYIYIYKILALLFSNLSNKQIKKIRGQLSPMNSPIPLWPPWHAQYRAVFPALSKPLTPTRLSKHSLNQLRLPEKQFCFTDLFFLLKANRNITWFFMKTASPAMNIQGEKVIIRNNYNL